MDIIDIKTSHIYPLHEVRDGNKLRSLTDAMVAGGWSGRPLLVIEYADGYQALTGSHRWAAAKAAGMDVVPCLVISAADAGDEYANILQSKDDDERMGYIRGSGCAAAEALMARELADAAV